MPQWFLLPGQVIGVSGSRSKDMPQEGDHEEAPDVGTLIDRGSHGLLSLSVASEERRTVLTKRWARFSGAYVFQEPMDLSSSVNLSVSLSVCVAAHEVATQVPAVTGARTTLIRDMRGVVESTF